MNIKLGVRIGLHNPDTLTELKRKGIIPIWLTRGSYLDIVCIPNQTPYTVFRDSATTQHTNLIIAVDDVDIIETLLSYFTLNAISVEAILSLVPVTAYQKKRLIHFDPNLDVTTLIKSVTYDDQGNPIYTYWSK